jgi:hypothetical protein
MAAQVDSKAVAALLAQVLRPPEATAELRHEQYRQRIGPELTDDNVWIRERLRELNSLQDILDRLAADETAANDAIAGATDCRCTPQPPSR